MQPEQLLTRAVYAKGAAKEKNQLARFTFALSGKEQTTLYLAAGSTFLGKVNGKFAFYGPMRAEHGAALCHEYDLTRFLTENENLLEIFITAYNINSYYIVDEPAFFSAAVVRGGKTVATEHDFTAYREPQKVQKVQRYSFQRNFVEVYDLRKASVLSETEEVPLPRLKTVNLTAPDYGVLACSAIERGAAEERDGLYPYAIPEYARVGGTCKGYPENELEVNLLNEINRLYYRKKTENDAAVYPEFTVYLDDIDIKRYDEYPEIPLPENEPELDITFEGARARANLKNAVMVLAGYDADGALLSAEIARNDGNASLELNGEYASAKVFLFNSFDNLKPVAMLGKKRMPTVACWGDSLTEGQGSSDFRKGGTKSYPGVLKTLTGYDVRNMGSAGETAMSIAARQGAVNALLEKDVTIPSDCTEVEIEFKGYNDDGTYAGTLTPRNKKDWNPCVINGVEGELSFKVDTTKNPRVLIWAKFKRKTPGEAVYAPKGTKIFMPNNIKINENADINVIFTGTNGVWNAEDKSGEDYADDLVILIRKMLAKTKNPDKYIIIGLTTRARDDWKITDAKMKEAFGEHIVFPRDRIATTEVLTDNGIKPTDQDIADIAVGRVPTSLRLAVNDVHFTDVGYAEIAKLVYAKMIELGYCE